MNTRELIARQVYTKHIRDGVPRYKARFFVFCKTGEVIPFEESKKLEKQAKVVSDVL
jgi:hypothetical protein